MAENYLVSGPEIDVGNPPAGGMGQMFLENMRTYSDKLAQVDSESGHTDTFGDMLEKSIYTAIHLKKRGIKPQDIISICSNNNLNNGVTFIAAQFVGAVPANLDPTLSLKETVYLLNQVKPKIIFVSEDAIKLIEEAAQITNLSSEIVVYGRTNKHTEFQEFLLETGEEKSFELAPISSVKDTATILFTSGSSGFPKGVCLNHYSLILLSRLHIHLWNFHADYQDLNSRPFLIFTTLYWISSVLSLITGIISGRCRILCRQFDPQKTLDLIDKYEISFLFISPSQIAEFYNLNIKNYIFKSPLKILTGGSNFSADQMIRIRKFLPNANIHQGYGQTELCGGILSFNDKLHEKFIREKPGSCGVAHPGLTLKVVDPETEVTLGPNCPGELRIKTKYGMNGYYKMDSCEVYDCDGWIKTGDLVYYDEDRCFYIVGRLKETFKYKGWHIQPAAIEVELLSHPAVKYAVVFGIPDETDGDHPAGVVVLNKESQATEEEILKFANARLSERQQLRGGLTIVNTLPTTPTGKVKKWELKEQILNKRLEKSK